MRQTFGFEDSIHVCLCLGAPLETVNNDLILLANSFFSQKLRNILTLITAQLNNLAEVRIRLNRSVAVEVLHENNSLELLAM